MPIIVPPADTLLCSVDEVKAQLDDVLDDSDDGELLDYVRAVTAPIEKYTGAILPVTRSKVVTADGNCLVLPDERVVSVTAVTGYIGSTAYSWAASPLGYAGIYGYRLDDTRPVLYTVGYSHFFGDYQVDYVAGMSTIPHEVNLAARLMVQSLWRSQNGGAGLPALSDEQQLPGATYDEMIHSPRIQALLSPWHRVPGLG